MYHIVIIYSSVAGHADWNYTLDVVNVTALNMDIFTFCSRKHTSLGICPGMVLLNHVVNIIFIFFRNIHNDIHSGCMSLYPTTANKWSFPTVWGEIECKYHFNLKISDRLYLTFLTSLLAFNIYFCFENYPLSSKVNFI